MADQDEATAAVVEGLKRLYHTKLKPLEQTYMFGWFHSPPLTDSEFESKPQVLMCGQYSTGKTSVSRRGELGVLCMCALLLLLLLPSSWSSLLLSFLFLFLFHTRNISENVAHGKSSCMTPTLLRRFPGRPNPEGAAFRVGVTVCLCVCLVYFSL